MLKNFSAWTTEDTIYSPIVSLFLTYLEYKCFINGSGIFAAKSRCTSIDYNEGKKKINNTETFEKIRTDFEPFEFDLFCHGEIILGVVI